MLDGRGRRMIQLLEREYDAIKTGDFEALNALAPEKDKLMRAMERGGVGPGDLGHIRSRATVNARLMKAAISGVRNAQGRLGALQRAQESLSVYDANGQVAKVARGQGALEHKA